MSWCVNNNALFFVFALFFSLICFSLFCLLLCCEMVTEFIVWIVHFWACHHTNMWTVSFFQELFGERD